MKVLCGVVLLVTALVSSSEGGPLGSHRIVNGTEISIKEAPYQVSLNNGCGGSILTKRHIATAAHCVLNSDCKFIRAGSSNKHRLGQVIEVDQVFKHPKWNFDTGSHDFALILLAEDLVLNENVKPITLAREPVPDGTIFIVSGWGFTNDASIDGTFLRAVELPQVNHDECQKMCKVRPDLPEIDESMVCAGYLEGGKAHCSGDSGGPLVFNKTLYGIVSWSGKPCGSPRLPGVYASVPKAYDWYMSLIKDSM